jgi:hypothetical protein
VRRRFFVCADFLDMSGSAQNVPACRGTLCDRDRPIARQLYGVGAVDIEDAVIVAPSGASVLWTSAFLGMVWLA